MADTARTFLYAEMQLSAPFDETIWRDANAAMQQVEGLTSKTWLSGIGTRSVGGFYEFESIDHARAYAHGLLANFARRAEAALTVKLFDGEIVRAASLDMASPFFTA